MGIEAQFTMADIRKRFAGFVEEIDKAAIETLQLLGEESITLARTLSPNIGFNDVTGNLRGSLGYVIFKNGEALTGNFAQVLAGNEGPIKGRELAVEVGQKTTGLQLVVVAGMEYAAALEAGGAWKVKSRRNYDVLTSAELHAKDRAVVLMYELVDDIKASLK